MSLLPNLAHCCQYFQRWISTCPQQVNHIICWLQRLFCGAQMSARCYNYAITGRDEGLGGKIIGTVALWKNLALPEDNLPALTQVTLWSSHCGAFQGPIKFF